MGKACDLNVYKNSAFFCILDEQSKKLLEKTRKAMFCKGNLITVYNHTGIQKYSDMSILSEIGNDMSSFGKASQFGGLGWLTSKKQ